MNALLLLCRFVSTFWWYREVGVARQVEGRIEVDDDGQAVLLVTERTGVAVENQEGIAVAVQTAVRRIVLGNVRNRQQQQITEQSDDEEGCCCCVFKWTLIVLLAIICLPFLPLICLCYCCSRDE